MKDWGKIAIAVRVGSGADGIFCQSILAVAQAGLRAGDVILEPTSGLPHHYAAEALAKQFLASDCDTLMFIDDDMVFAADDIERLRADERGWSYGILQGLVVRSQPPYDPQTGTPRPKPNDVYEVPHCGLAFVMIRRDVISDVVRNKAKGEMCFTWGMDGMAEDVSFCHKAVAAGWKCGCHSGVLPGHRVTVVARFNPAKQKAEFTSMAYNGLAKVKEYTCLQ